MIKELMTENLTRVNLIVLYYWKIFTLTLLNFLGELCSLYFSLSLYVFGKRCMVGVRKGKNLLHFNICMLFKNLQELPVLMSFCSDHAGNSTFNPSFRRWYKDARRSSLLLKSSISFFWTTWDSVSSKFILCFSFLNAFFCLLGIWRVEKSWRDLAHGAFITTSSSVGRDPCGSSTCGSNKFQNCPSFHAWICRNNRNWQFRLYVTCFPFPVCMHIQNSLFI